MKKYIFIILLLLKTISVISQPKLNVDSLEILLAEAKEDTARIILMAQLCGELHLSSPDSSLKFGQAALGLAQKINYRKGELYSMTGLGKLAWSIGDYSAALRLLLPITKNGESLNDPWLRINVWAFITATYRDQGDYNEALKYSFKFTSIEDTYDKCNLCRHPNTATASIYLEMGLLDSASYFLRRAFSYPLIFGDDGWMYMIAGRTQAGLKNYDSAFYFYHQSIKKLTLEDNQKDLAGAYYSIAALFEKLKQNDSTLFYARKALAISHSKQYNREFMMTSLLLSNTYELLNTDSAFHYHKLAMEAKDSLYNQEKQRQILNYKFNEELRQQELKNEKEHYRNKLKIYALIIALTLIIIIAIILYRNNQQKQKASAKIEKAYSDLKSTQAQLIQSEKMASLGELTAGIAHEIQNPLNFVNNFSDVNKELLVEMKDEMSKGNIDDANAIANDVIENSDKINHHGKRAEAIVKGMLQHSRQTSGTKEPVDINALCDEYLRLAYHGLRAKDKDFNATLKTEFDESLSANEAGIGNINIIPQDIGRVLLNLFNNAFYATNQKQKDLAGRATYVPIVTIVTKKINNKIEITVADNGNGIPQNIVDKIFQPFFTTKPTGQGTGLGLSLSYDIVKAHGGEIKVETKEGEGTVFTIQLPVS